MKKSLIKEWRSKNKAELDKIILSQRDDLVRILIDLKSNKLKNTAVIGNKRRTIAIISTLLKEKETAKI